MKTLYVDVYPKAIVLTFEATNLASTTLFIEIEDTTQIADYIRPYMWQGWNPKINEHH